MNRIMLLLVAIMVLPAIDVRGGDTLRATSSLTSVQSETGTGLAPLVFSTPPYQQNRSTTGMVIMCELPQEIPLRLEYGQTTAYGSNVDFQSEPSGGSTWVYRALITGLKPQQAYHYRVALTSGVPASADATFITATTNNIDFSFGVWSDSQGNNHSDWDLDPLEPSRSMMLHMAAAGVAFGLTSGDVSQNGMDYNDTRLYYLDRIARELGPHAPWYVAWGNHDTAATNAIVRRASDMPSRYRAGFSSGHGSFSFTYANCFFVCLDNYYQAEITNGWLRQELSSAAAQQARFRVVTIHVPPYCERWVDGDSKLRANLVPLMEQYRVDICFSGHTHEYERGMTNGIQYIVTGGSSYLDYPERIVKDWSHMTVGGAQNLPGSKRKQKSRGVLGEPQAIVGGLVHEYCFVQVHENSLKLECRAFNADGSYIGVLDSFERRASPPSSPIDVSPAKVKAE